MGDEAAREYNRVVGANIRRWQKAAKVSQKQAGETIGVSFQQFQKHEKGINRISACSLWQLADSYEVPLENFFTTMLHDVDEEFNLILAAYRVALRKGEKENLCRFLKVWGLLPSGFGVNNGFGD